MKLETSELFESIQTLLNTYLRLADMCCEDDDKVLRVRFNQTSVRAYDNTASIESRPPILELPRSASTKAFGSSVVRVRNGVLMPLAVNFIAEGCSTDSTEEME